MVIDRQVMRQPSVLNLGVLEHHRIRPFLSDGLDKPLSLVVGSWRVRFGADMLLPEDAAGLGKAA